MPHRCIISEGHSIDTCRAIHRLHHPINIDVDGDTIDVIRVIIDVIRAIIDVIRVIIDVIRVIRCSFKFSRIIRVIEDNRVIRVIRVTKVIGVI